MKEFKGTKDWKAVKLKATGFYRERTEIQFGNDGECVAEFVHNDYDAKLIAAAPELLEVCIDLKEILYNISMPAKVMNDLEQAINKALN